MIKLSQEEILVISAALFSLVIGAVVNHLLGDCSIAFQRSGSVVVCIGIIFTFFDVGGVYDGIFEAELERLREKRMEIDIVFSDAELEREIRGSTNYLINRARSVQLNGKTRAALIDLGVLILGTIVWGIWRPHHIVSSDRRNGRKARIAAIQLRIMNSYIGSEKDI